MTKQVGGRITISIGGQRFSPRGKASIRTAGVNNTAGANHDGTLYATSVAKPVGADISFDRGKASNGTARPRWDTAFMTQSVDVTIVEIDAGVMHVFTDCTIVGDPVIDTESGEVSGLSIATSDANYRQTSL